jgi:hypothetical protein
MSYVCFTYNNNKINNRNLPLGYDGISLTRFWQFVPLCLVGVAVSGSTRVIVCSKQKRIWMSCWPTRWAQSTHFKVCASRNQNMVAPWCHFKTSRSTILGTIGTELPSGSLQYKYCVLWCKAGQWHKTMFQY